MLLCPGPLDPSRLSPGYTSSRSRAEAAAGNRGEVVGGARTITMTSKAAEMTCSAATSRQKELYGQLCERLKEVERLGSVEALLSWDEQVKNTSFLSLERYIRSTIHLNVMK